MIIGIFMILAIYYAVLGLSMICFEKTHEGKFAGALLVVGALLFLYQVIQPLVG